MTDQPTPQPEKKWTLKGILFLVVIFVGVPLGGLALLWRDRCHHQMLPGLPSPDGLFFAQQVITDCGTSMKVATEVRVHHATAGQPAPGKGETVLLIPFDKELPITWRSARTLAVTLPPKSEMVKKEPHWDGITLEVQGDYVIPKWQQGLEKP